MTSSTTSLRRSNDSQELQMGEFAKTDRAIKVQKLIATRDLNKTLEFLFELSVKNRLNYSKHGETLSTYALRICIQNHDSEYALKVIDLFFLAGANFKEIGEKANLLQIIEKSALDKQAREAMLTRLEIFSSDLFSVSTEFSNSKKATQLRKYADTQNSWELFAFLQGLNKENKLKYVKNGETLLTHFLKTSIHSRKIEAIIFVIDAFKRQDYPFDFADGKGLNAIHIVICSSIPVENKKQILTRLVTHGASLQYKFQGLTPIETVLNYIKNSKIPDEWVDLLAFILNNGGNPNSGSTHPLCFAITTLTGKSKIDVINAFLESDLTNTEVSGSNPNSSTPLMIVMDELMQAKDEMTFSFVFQYAFQIIMRNAQTPEKRKDLQHLIQKAYKEDGAKARKIITSLYKKLSDANHHLLLNVMSPFSSLTWLHSFFKDSTSQMVNSYLAKAFQLSPELFKALKNEDIFSNKETLENIRRVDAAPNLSPMQKEQIVKLILKIGVNAKSQVITLLTLVGNLRDYFGENFKLKLLTHLAKMTPPSYSVEFLNQILGKLLDIIRIETNQFSSQNEILTILKLNPSEWEVKLENLGLRAYHAKYPEKPLNEVLENFKKVQFGLSDKELHELELRYKQILQYSIENKLQSYSEANIARAMRSSRVSVSSESDRKLQYDSLTIRMSLIRQAVLITEGYLPYNTQMLIVLAFITKSGKGRLAQVDTGQGKSLINAMIAAYYALEGNSVDVVTTSDTLAIRDAKSKSHFFNMLGLNVKHNCMDDQTHEACYKGAHVVYGTAYRFESAILHDLYTEEIVIGNRKPQIVIVDEVDSMFLDKGSHSTRLTFPDSRLEGLFWVYFEILKCVKDNPNVTVESVKNAILGSKDYNYSTEFVKDKIQLKLSDWVNSAKTALYRYAENKHYAIEDGKILPVDFQHTGAFESRTRFSAGLHQFLEIKHRLIPKSERNMGCCISHVSFFTRYKRIIGLSGSLGGEAERSELMETFKLDTFNVPPHIEGVRTIQKPIFVKNKQEWTQAIGKATLEQIRLGKAVLIIFKTIQDTKDFKKSLNYANSKLLNGSQSNSDEEAIVAQAGTSKMVTIATNKAGRGMDIRTTEQTDKAGGLHVLITFFPLNRRVEKQAVGRTSRMGKNGTVQMILNEGHEDIEEHAKSDGEKKLKVLEDNREKSEKFLSIERLKVVIPIAKHVDFIVMDFCSKLAEIKDNYNKHEVKALKERWAEWISQVDDSKVDEGGIEKWKKTISEQYQKLIQLLQKDLTEGNIIQNPDIYVSWGNELNGVEAIKKYSAAIALDPGHPFAYLKRGLVYEKTNLGAIQKDLTNAIKGFTRYIKLNPTRPGYYLGRGIAYFNLKRFAEASSDLTEALKLDNGNLQAYLDRAEALGQLNQWDAAIRDYKELIKKTREKDISSEDRAELFNIASAGLRKAGQYKDAKLACLEALLMPSIKTETNWRLNFRLGLIYTEDLKDAKTGINYFRKALDIVPDKSSISQTVALAYYNLGVGLFKEENIKEAIENYDRALTLASSDNLICTIYHNLGVAYDTQGNQTKAAACYQSALKINPDLKKSKDNLGRIYLERGDIFSAKDQLDDALECYTSAQKFITDPDDLYNLNNSIGQMYRKKEQYSSAISFFEAAIKLNSDEKPARNNLARVYFLLAESTYESNPDSSIDYCNKSLKLDSSDPELKSYVYTIGGLAQQNLRNYNQAIANFNEAIRLRPEDDYPKRNLAKLYLSLANDAADSSTEAHLAPQYYQLALGVGTTDKELLSVAYNDFGILLKKHGKIDEALQYYFKAIEYGSDEAKINVSIIYFNRGVEYHNSGQMHLARYWYGEAQKYDPTNQNIHTNIMATYSLYK